MKIQSQPGQDRSPKRHRAIYGAYLTLIIGQGMLLGALLRHQSLAPSVFGRYSVKFTLVLGLVALLFVVSAVVLLAQGRRMPTFCIGLASRLEKRPGLLAGLIVLGGVLVTTTLAFHKIMALFFPPFMVVASVAVIYAGLVGLILTILDTRQQGLVRERMVLMALGLGIGLALGEVGLRIHAQGMPYRVLMPHLQAVFDPAPGVMPGIAGVSVFTTSAEGIRGTPYEPTGRYNMLAIGGSTTECAYLDDTEAWPYLLEQHLNEQGHRPPAWVGNVGRSGHALVEHIHALRYFVPQFEIDAVIVMVGINDLVHAWRDPERYEASAYDPDNFVRFFYRSFSQRPLVDAAVFRPFPENLALWNLAEQGFWRLYHTPLRSFEYLYKEDQAGLRYVSRRQIFQEASGVIDELPNLTAALDRYERNLMSLVDAAQTQDVRLVLTTQPAMYSDSLSAEAVQLLWLGTRNPDGQYRYSLDVLTQALGLFNEKLLQVCRNTATECIDLATAMNGDERYFYDDVHFNEAGAQAVARLLAAYLKPAE